MENVSRYAELLPPLHCVNWVDTQLPMAKLLPANHTNVRVCEGGQIS